jgi:hypothetical protein
MAERMTPHRKRRMRQAEEDGLGERYGNNYGYAREGEQSEPLSSHVDENEYVDRYRPPKYPQPEETSGPYAGVGPKGYQRSDSRIHEEICERLSLHGQIDARGIDLQVQDGEVFLKGSIRNRLMKRLAEDVALESIGVRDVYNQLRISRK